MYRMVPQGILALSVVLGGGGAAIAAGFGDVEGQFVLDGQAPMPKVIIEKGADVKDKEVCAADTLYSDEFVVDEETNGIANIFIYLRKAPSKIHPDLKEVPEDPVEFDQKGCVFMPHALFVRTGQDVLVKSQDPVPHNTHSHPLRNDEENYTIRANDREGVPFGFEQPEPLPTKINCDFHPHMTAYWLVLDHPYAAITDKEGKFTLKGLPEGEHTFTVWHEKVGYLDRAFKVTVQADETTTIEPVKVPVAKFK